MAHDRIAHKTGVGQSIHMTHERIAYDQTGVGQPEYMTHDRTLHDHRIKLVLGSFTVHVFSVQLVYDDHRQSLFPLISPMRYTVQRLLSTTACIIVYLEEISLQI
jgi:hypothetical protein